MVTDLDLLVGVLWAGGVLALLFSVLAIAELFRD